MVHPTTCMESSLVTVLCCGHSGDKHWPPGCTLRHVHGELFGHHGCIHVDGVSPGEVLDIGTEFTSPAALPGAYEGQWRLTLPTGEHFGGNVVVVLLSYNASCCLTTPPVVLQRLLLFYNASCCLTTPPVVLQRLLLFYNASCCFPSMCFDWYWSQYSCCIVCRNRGHCVIYNVGVLCVWVIVYYCVHVIR